MARSHHLLYISLPVAISRSVPQNPAYRHCPAPRYPGNLRKILSADEDPAKTIRNEYLQCTLRQKAWMKAIC